MSATEIIDPASVLPAAHFSPGISLFFVLLQLALFALALAIAGLSWLRWWRRARLAERTFKEDAALQPGEIVLQGSVEYARTAELAVRVEVEQAGSEQEGSSSWMTHWQELDRRIKVRPFYLRHQSGRRIRVEPSGDVQLFDTMDGVIRVNLTRRVRIAELTPGEQVFAHGQLVWAHDPEEEGGYRGGQHGLVLRPAGQGHLLLSSEPLGERFRRRARLHRGFTIFTLVLGILTALLTSEYYLRLACGQPGRAEITELKHLVEEDSEGDAHHYRIWLRLAPPHQGSFADDVDQELWNQLLVGMELPVRVTRSRWSSNRVGAGATYHGGLLILQLVFPVLILVLYPFSARQTLFWNEGRLDEAEGGRLQDSMPPAGEDSPGGAARA